MIVDRLSLEQSAVLVAPRLLGSVIVRKTADNRSVKVKIIETEAYRENDPASHSFNGKTPRSEVMFGPPGYWYLYQCYGIHWMLNLVCGPAGQGEAVLIRAVEPLSGEKLMFNWRPNQTGVDLSNGPGKLTEALNLLGQFNGTPAWGDTDLRLQPAPAETVIYESPRVGISLAKERYWRFYLKSDYLSRVKQNAVGRRRN